uniref:Tetratricopeptide repeat-containing protein n=1 Tax=Chromera velia CCMP2878 TaxID=1169474 RepID=A0A0G4HUZ1_9ALVE|eukprot:Cvel_1396.t1-p1 / transcript=Cvel_1396.t1 / gene=Cvel_1396 / organism=Chromera_velia_CCMP2878 / gene_product=Transmembrane and TPR repeat-containing protein 4, putative / transcript_product=Transmembrane and TPR repeat-containing protein 4, putative / location=Cvel_scaffold48:140648-147027(+) / protein_length=1590 / sequence_SO=supercontig / SO=protein_coding / is_pseudo=false
MGCGSSAHGKVRVGTGDGSAAVVVSDPRKHFFSSADLLRFSAEDDRRRGTRLLIEICKIRDFIRRHSNENAVTLLFHYTSPEAASIILQEGVRTWGGNRPSSGLHASVLSPMAFHWPATGWRRRAASALFGSENEQKMQRHTARVVVFAVVNDAVRKDSDTSTEGKEKGHWVTIPALPEGLASDGEHRALGMLDLPGGRRDARDNHNTTVLGRHGCDRHHTCADCTKVRFFALLDLGTSEDPSSDASNEAALRANLEEALRRAATLPESAAEKLQEVAAKADKIIPSSASTGKQRQQHTSAVIRIEAARAIGAFARYALARLLRERFENAAKAKNVLMEALQLDCPPALALAGMYLGDMLLEKDSDFYDPDAALHVFREVTRADGSLFQAQLQTGLLLKARQSDYEGARIHYEAAVNIDPRCSAGHYNLALLLHSYLKVYTAAREHYQKAVALVPSFAKAHNNLGNLLRDHFSDFQGARRHYEVAIRQDPSNPTPRTNLGLLFQHQLKKPEEARRQFTKAIEHAEPPSDAEPRHRLGLLLCEAGRPEADLTEGKRELAKACKLDPENPQIHYDFAMVLFHVFKEAAWARTHFRKALDLGLNTPEVETNYAQLLLQAVPNRPTEAEKLLRSALQKLSEASREGKEGEGEAEESLKAKVAARLAVLLAEKEIEQQDDVQQVSRRIREESKTFAEMARETDPEEWEGHFALGVFFYLQVSALREARTSLDLAVRLGGSEAARAHLFLVRLLWETGELAGARAELDTAMELTTSKGLQGSALAETHTVFGAFSFEACGEVEEARAHLQKALAIDPLQPQAHETAGRIAWREKRDGKTASHHFMRALKSRPHRAALHAQLAEALMGLHVPDPSEAAKHMRLASRYAVSPGEKSEVCFRLACLLRLPPLRKSHEALAECLKALEAGHPEPAVVHLFVASVLIDGCVNVEGSPSQLITRRAKVHTTEHHPGQGFSALLRGLSCGGKQGDGGDTDRERETPREREKAIRDTKAAAHHLDRAVKKAASVSTATPSGEEKGPRGGGGHVLDPLEETEVALCVGTLLLDLVGDLDTAETWLSHAVSRCAAERQGEGGGGVNFPSTETGRGREDLSGVHSAKVRALSETEGLALYALSRVAKARGKREDAVSLLRAALGLRPGVRAAEERTIRLALALALRHDNRREAALEVEREALEIRASGRLSAIYEYTKELPEEKSAVGDAKKLLQLILDHPCEPSTSMGVQSESECLGWSERAHACYLLGSLLLSSLRIGKSGKPSRKSATEVERHLLEAKTILESREAEQGEVTKVSNEEIDAALERLALLRKGPPKSVSLAVCEENLEEKEEVDRQGEEGDEPREEGRLEEVPEESEDHYEDQREEAGGIEEEGDSCKEGQRGMEEEGDVDNVQGEEEKKEDSPWVQIDEGEEAREGQLSQDRASETHDTDQTAPSSPPPPLKTFRDEENDFVDTDPNGDENEEPNRMPVSSPHHEDLEREAQEPSPNEEHGDREDASKRQESLLCEKDAMGRTSSSAHRSATRTPKGLKAGSGSRRVPISLRAVSPSFASAVASLTHDAGSPGLLVKKKRRLQTMREKTGPGEE